MLICRDCGAGGPEEEFTEITEAEILEDFQAGHIDAEEYEEALSYNVGRFLCGCGTLMSPDD